MHGIRGVCLSLQCPPTLFSTGVEWVVSPVAVNGNGMKCRSDIGLVVGKPVRASLFTGDRFPWPAQRRPSLWSCIWRVRARSGTPLKPSCVWGFHALGAVPSICHVVSYRSFCGLLAKRLDYERDPPKKCTVMDGEGSLVLQCRQMLRTKPIVLARKLATRFERRTSDTCFLIGVLGSSVARAA